MQQKNCEKEGGGKPAHQLIQAFYHPNSIRRDVELFQLHQRTQTLQLRDSVVLVSGRFDLLGGGAKVMMSFINN